MATKLYSDVDLGALVSFERPSRNAAKEDYSCFSQSPGLRVQCARIDDDPKPRVGHLLESRTGARGLLLQLRSPAQARWFSELQSQIVCEMTARCEEWFGKPMSIEDVRAMYKPFVMDGGGSAQLRVSSDAGLYVIDAETGRPEPVEDWSLVERGMACVPIVKVVGLWVSKTRFGAVVTVSELMLFEEEEEEEEEESDHAGEDDASLSKTPFSIVAPDLHDDDPDDELWGQTRDEPLDEDEEGSFSTRVPFNQPRSVPSFGATPAAAAQRHGGGEADGSQ